MSRQNYKMKNENIKTQMYTLDDICQGCVNAIICDCSQNHVYDCKIKSEKINRKSGTCADREE